MLGEADHAAGKNHHVDAFGLDRIDYACAVVGAGDVCLNVLVEPTVCPWTPANPDHAGATGEEPFRECLPETACGAHEQDTAAGEGGHISSLDDCPQRCASKWGEFRPLSAPVVLTEDTQGGII